MLLEFLESLEFLEFHKLPHIPQATTTDQHETGEVIKKATPTIKVHTEHSTNNHTFHKLPRLSSND